MSRSKIARLLAATALVAASMIGSLLVATPAGANVSVTTSGATTPGSTVAVTSAFTAPNKNRGYYVVDTEIFDAGGKRVAQFSERIWLGWSTTYRKYSWNTSGLAAGRYRIAQGIFTADWSASRSWVKEASFVTLGTPAPVAAPLPVPSSTWQLTSSASGTGNINVKSNFVAPSTNSAGPVVLDTEVYNAAGSKVAQWVENVTANTTQTFSRTYTWDSAGKTAGTYTVRQGVFVPDWSRNLAWNPSSSRFDVTALVAPVLQPVTDLLAPQPTSQTNASFWVDPSNPALRQAREWQASRPTDAALMSRMGQGAAAVWLGGWNANVKNDVTNITTAAASTGKTPVLVAYNIPGRDCGSYSAGGAGTADAYRTWVKNIVDGIADRKAWVVLEPDALSQLDCLNAGAKAERLALLDEATTMLAGKANVNVYIDAGHPGWHSASDMAQRLRSAGVGKARGFSLNVSNFGTTQENVSYGESVASLLGGKRYLVDTARNGNGSNGEWCNPSGRALGEMPTTSTGTNHGDAFLWVKRPGESDGTCNGGPSAGEWWADYALGLAQRAGN